MSEERISEAIAATVADKDRHEGGNTTHHLLVDLIHRCHSKKCEACNDLQSMLAMKWPDIAVIPHKELSCKITQVLS